MIINCEFEILDATNFEILKEIVIKHKITQIYHLAAILSANGEKYPLSTWDINMKTFFNILEVSRLNNVEKVFFPSSIAVFGDQAPLLDTPQSSFLNPDTVDAKFLALFIPAKKYINKIIDEKAISSIILLMYIKFHILLFSG